MLKAVAIKLFGAGAIAASFLFLPFPWCWVGAGGALFLTLGVIAWGVFNVNSGLWAATLWHAPDGGKRVALTFDDGPDPDFTPRVLDILHQKGVAAMFFCVGERVRRHPEITRQVHQRGHLLGNHSDSHAMWINFGLHRRLAEEIDKAGAAIENAAGVAPRLYRAPHGFKNPALGDVLKSRGMTAVGWQVRGFDAVRGNAAKIAQRIVDGARPGGVILLHDGAGLQGGNDRGATLEALPVIIDGLKARGLKIVPLDELLGVDAYAESGH